MNEIVETFRRNLKSVDKLINFDKDVMDEAIKSITELHRTLTAPPYGIANEQSNGKRTIDFLKAIRQNDSLKNRYSVVNNQAVVLLVSYFSSAISDLFKVAAKLAITSHKDKRVLTEELKLNVEELLHLADNLGDSIGQLLISKDSISFQDMKSIQRAFHKYFGIMIDKDLNVNNIIVSQACRHAIAHEAGKTSARLLNQVKYATPRSIKNTFTLDSTICFEPEELKVISNSMESYVESLASNVENYRSRGCD